VYAILHDSPAQGLSVLVDHDVCTTDGPVQGLSVLVDHDVCTADSPAQGLSVLVGNAVCTAGSPAQGLSVLEDHVVYSTTDMILLKGCLSWSRAVCPGCMHSCWDQWLMGLLFMGPLSGPTRAKHKAFILVPFIRTHQVKAPSKHILLDNQQP